MKHCVRCFKTSDHISREDAEREPEPIRLHCRQAVRAEVSCSTLKARFLVALCNLAHSAQQFCHSDYAMRDGINLGLCDALEIRPFRVDYCHEFFPKFEHGTILTLAQEPSPLDNFPARRSYRGLRERGAGNWQKPSALMSRHNPRAQVLDVVAGDALRVRTTISKDGASGK